MVSIKTCSEAGCEEPIKAQGRCRRHYNLWLAVRPDGKPCSKDGCGGVAFIKGLCQPHYSKQQYDARKVKSCCVDGCGKSLWANGLCRKHWDEGRPAEPRVALTGNMVIELEKIKDVLTSGEVAKVCNVAPRTVAKWIDSGTLQGYKLPGSRDRRVTKVSLLSFLRDNNMPIHVAAKRSAILFGFPADIAAIAKKLAEEDLDINVEIVSDPFSAGVVMTERKPSVVLVHCDYLAPLLPMLKLLELSTAEVVVAVDDAEKVQGMGVHALPCPYRVKDVVAAIAQYI